MSRRAASCAIALLGGCVFDLDQPPADPIAVTPGVYAVDVRVQDGCGVLQLNTGELDCEGGLAQTPDGSLDAFWPQPWNAAYLVHHDVLPRSLDAPVQRFTATARERIAGCTNAEHIQSVQLSSTAEDRLDGTLLDSWSGVATCPFGTQVPAQDCSIAWAYTYELVEACAAPCELVDAAAGTEAEPYDCGASVCRCP